MITFDIYRSLQLSARMYLINTSHYEFGAVLENARV